MTNNLILHVGLPRTATTILQRHIFTKLANEVYLGKNWNNKIINKFNPLKLISESYHCLIGNQAESSDILCLLATLVSLLKRNNQFQKKSESKRIVEIINVCFENFLKVFPEKKLIYSDESLIESVAGLSSNISHGDDIPLEQLVHASGVIRNSTILVVLREPFDFLRASWYKNNEFQHQYKLQPISFEIWLKNQLDIFNKRKSASRIFLALQKSFTLHLKSFCPNLIMTHYEDLIIADDVMSCLTSGIISAPNLNFKNLAKENASFRSADVIDFILSAPDIPRGISMTDYVAGFDMIYKKFNLYDLLINDMLD